MRQRKRQSRRGVVLLVVLSLLVLFLLMGVTFIVVSGQYKDGAIAAAKYRLIDEDPRKIPDTAIYQLLRDVPVTSSSSLYEQSLLADLYGNDGVRVIITSRPVSPVGSATDYRVPRFENDTTQGVDSEFFGMVVRTGNTSLGRSEDYYAGRVITFLTGRAAGLSTRIVDDLSFTMGPDGGWGVAGTDDDGINGVDDIGEAFWANSDDQRLLRMEILNSDTGSATLPSIGDQVLINGQAFNGTGYGYDNTTGNIDSVVWFKGDDGAWGDVNTDDDGNGVIDDSSEAGFGDDTTFANTSLPLALFSHRTTQPSRGIFGTHAGRTSAGGSVSASYGGADETWDAVDFQNNFLAYVPTNLTGVGQIIPSFHRPSLVLYVFDQLRTASSLPFNFGATGVNAAQQAWIIFNNPYTSSNTLTGPQRRLLVDVKRACTFRPLAEDHPNFNGSNTAFHFLGNAPAYGSAGSWDVDNDGDGVADSVWIDIGLPVKTASDGRVYKPLVSILCRDLDGRININAHGSLDLLPSNLQTSYEWHPGFDGAWGRAGVDDDGNSVIDDFSEAGATNSDDRRIVGANAFNRFQFPRGSGYGPAEISLLPLVSGSSTAAETIMGTRNRRANSALTLQPSGRVDNSDDEIDLVRNFNMPYNFATTRSSYGTPPDLRGRGAYGLNRLGHPLAPYMGLARDKVDDPYESVLDIERITGGGPGDLLFTLAELERLLRPYDADSAKLPSRLFDIAPSGFLGGARNMLTVHSSHIPVPVAIFPPESRAGSRSPSIVDLYSTKINAAKRATTVTQDELDKMMPFEFRRGQRFDINRVFGNGRDDNNNGVVDEPAEEYAGQDAWINDTAVPVDSRLPGSSRFLNVSFSHGNDDPLSAGSRATYARHLYCLMMMIVDQANLHPTVQGGLTQMQRDALTAQRIAQWAINVVDFRDSDAIMTPFEYDIYPLTKSKGPDGEWGVAGVDDDGNLTIDDISEALFAGSDDIAGGWKVDGTIGTADDTAAYRGLVWGCEYPDLLLTETFATHDRRVRDTEWDDGLNTNDPNHPNPEKKREETMDEDSDPDQFRLPQGSVFFELYCTRNESNPILPRELYNSNGRLDLGRLAPERIIGMANVRHPVWRIAIADATSATSPLAAAYSATPDTVALEPVDMGLTVDRYVWFSPNDPAGAPEAGQVFFGQGGTITPPTSTTDQATSNVQVAPSRYVVVGPRTTTAMGLQRADSDGDPATVDVSTQQLNLAGGNFTVSNTGITYPTVGTTIQQPVAVVCAAKPPTAWVNQARRVGMNVSEPLPSSGNYYREPVAGTPDLYVDFGKPIITDPADPDYNALPDQPFDEEMTYPLGGDVNTRTKIDFRSAFLQRLADPTLPWNPLPGQTGYDSTLTVNPYITTDWSTVDLTVFNGDEVSSSLASGGWSDPEDMDPLASSTAPPDDTDDEHFATRQRNGVKFNIWSPRTSEPAVSTTKPRAAVDHFPYALAHTLGFLNNGLNSGYASSPPPSTPDTAANNLGGPRRPFPWLTWNDRPYVSPFELLDVPTSSPARLLYEFTAPGVSQDALDEDDHPFSPNPLANPFVSTPGSEVDTFRAPYGHLLNFFLSDAAGTSVGNFARLFDFVETPSPFAETEKWFNPIAFETGSSGVEFRPPFNKLSRFRDPGRINLNTSGLFISRGPDGEWGRAGVDDDGDSDPMSPTAPFLDNEREALWPGSDDVYEGQVWEAIAKLFPGMDPTIQWHPGPDGAWGVAGVDDDGMNGVDDIGEAGWSNGPDDYTDDSDDFRPVRTLLHLIETMQGTGSYPTVISNPLRAAMSADLMPAISDMRTKNAVEATLLRSHPPKPDPMVITTPLTPAPHPLEPTSTDPLFFNYSEMGLNDTKRNAYFRNQGLTRLSNLITSQSNVYATWVTVGFFEVEGNPGSDGVLGTADDVDVTHPDGYRLAQELGLETGEVKRHRAFYLIDRSIPVAFEPGENHNVDRAILLRRFIE